MDAVLLDAVRSLAGLPSDSRQIIRDRGGRRDKPVYVCAVVVVVGEGGGCCRRLCINKVT